MMDRVRQLTLVWTKKKNYKCVVVGAHLVLPGTPRPPCACTALSKHGVGVESLF